MKLRRVFLLTVLVGVASCASDPGGTGIAKGVQWTLGEVGGTLRAPETVGLVRVGDSVVLNKVDSIEFSALKTLHVSRFSLSRAYYLQLSPGVHNLSVLYRKEGMETRTPVELRVNVEAGKVYRLFADEPKDAVYRIRFNFEPSSADAAFATAHFNQVKGLGSE